MAAAVLFDLERLSLSDRRALARLNDSKQHDEDGREEIYPLVLRAAARVAVACRCVRGIDARGLHVTNLDALRSALATVTRDLECQGASRPDHAGPASQPAGGLALDLVCLSDGFRVPGLGVEQRAVVGGDSRSAAIAAASVVAKVTRDRYMRRAASRHPGWDFHSNVGYSTPEHRDAIALRGISPLHRLSFQSIAYQQLALEG